MIPKIFHYCWFGPAQIPKQQQDYINGWKNMNPEWEVILWNEDNFPLNEYKFALSAYQQKKYAFVTDYVRVWALNKFGGVYLDTDVELKKSLNNFLNCEAFSCIETVGIGFTSAVWGSIPQHSLTNRMLDYYLNKTYNENEPPNTITISNILQKNYSINPNKDINQIGSDNINSINIYASHYFCLDLPINYASHHFIGSWLNKDKTESYKNKIHQEYLINSSLDGNVINNKTYLKQVSKKLTFINLIKVIKYFIKNKFS